MCFKKYIKLFYILLACLWSFSAKAQSTVVTGKITDAATKQPLSFVSVSFQGTTIGVTTNDQGTYALSTPNTSYTKLQVSFVGYKTAVYTIKPGQTQELDIKLAADSKQLNAVVIQRGKKQRYTNKDNPAVELIRKVIANKEKNRPEAYNYVEYKGYERLNLSFINVSPEFSNRKFFRKYKFMIDNRDTTSVPGKNLLPIFLNEKVYNYYYSKNPERRKTKVLGEKGVEYSAAISSDGIAVYFKHLYQDIDIYANSSVIVTNDFLNPIADGAPGAYKFFITDTVEVNGHKVVELSFTPRNVQDMLFEGTLFVTLDGNYAVQKAQLTLNRKINLNWVKEMTINLEFEQNPDGRYHLSKSTTWADFGLSKKKEGGIFGQRTMVFKEYKTNVPRPDTTYQGTSEVTSDEVKNRSNEFWSQNRLDTLSTAEAKTYDNIDSVGRMKSFRRTVDIASLLLFGYKSVGWWDIGPANTFYSFNPVEGFRLRGGGRTNVNFSKRALIESYVAYGFKDQKFKYYLAGAWSFNKNRLYQFPHHYIRVSYQHDTGIPGQDLQFVREDNFLLSFKRGNNDKFLYNDFYRIDYAREFPSRFSYMLSLRRWSQTPAGSLYFSNVVNGLPNNINRLTTTQGMVTLRYAPHEEFYQGKIYRKAFWNKYPVITLEYTAGLKNIIGGQNSYHNVTLNFYKHFFYKQLGFADLTVEGSKLFGQVPYPLLTIHRANQSFALGVNSYNMMNFLEFVSDHYAAVNYDHHFNGLFFNRVPLLKKLKWREVLQFKTIFGGVTDRNDPALHPSLFEFPKYADGTPITYKLNGKPYAEGSVGIENIFKVLRVDLVRRFTYLNNPDVPKWGIRTRVQFVF